MAWLMYTIIIVICQALSLFAGIRLPDVSVVELYDRKIIRQPQVQKSTSREGPARNIGKGMFCSSITLIAYLVDVAK